MTTIAAETEVADIPTAAHSSSPAEEHYLTSTPMSRLTTPTSRMTTTTLEMMIATSITKTTTSTLTVPRV